MGGTGGQQAHPHDVILLHRPLSQLGHAPVQLTLVAGDAGEKHQKQARRQQKADEHPLDVQVEEVPMLGMRHRERLVPVRQNDEGHGRYQAQAAGQAEPEHGDAEDHLKQEQGDEGIGRTAAQVELTGQGQHIGQKPDEDLGIGNGGSASPAKDRNTVPDDQGGENGTHARQGQVDADSDLDGGDRDHLSDDGDPAQQDQQSQIFAIGGVQNARFARHLPSLTVRPGQDATSPLAHARPRTGP